MGRFGLLLVGTGSGDAVSAAALASIRKPKRVSGTNGLANRAMVIMVLAAIPVVDIGMLSTFGILAALAFAALFNLPWLPTAQQTKSDVSEASRCWRASCSGR